MVEIKIFLNEEELDLYIKRLQETFTVKDVKLIPRNDDKISAIFFLGYKEDNYNVLLNDRGSMAILNERILQIQVGKNTENLAWYKDELLELAKILLVDDYKSSTTVWDKSYINKLKAKGEESVLAIAGALIAAHLTHLINKKEKENGKA